MKILLINPPRSGRNLILQYAPFDLKPQLEKIGLIGMPLALCSIAGNLLEHEVDIFDLKAEYDLGLGLSVEEAILKKLREFSPEIVGVTFLTSDYNNGIRILQIVKEFDRSILTIAGGIHASLCPEDFNLRFVDITIQGPGKKIFRDIVTAYSQKKGFGDIPNITIQNDGSLHYTKRVNLFEDASNLLSNVYANRSPVKKYDKAYNNPAAGECISFIETSLGCPSRCNFCSIWPVNAGNYFKRDIEDIIGELKTMDAYKAVRFVDANTLGDVAYANELLDAVIRAQLNKVLIMDIRADTAAQYPELIGKAAQAGLKVAIVGIESDDEEELEFYNKEASRDTILKALEVFNRFNINVRGIFIIQPDYGEKDFDRLSCFIKENDLQHCAFSIMTPFPGTPLYTAVKDRIIIKDLDYYNLFNSVFETKLPEAEFYRLIAELHRGKKGTR